MKTIKKDRYRKSRGGNTHIYEIYCSSCGERLLTYQKDGIGSILRLYIDRIHEVIEFTNLYCKKCKALIGTPMIYKNENRKALRLQKGSFSKKLVL